MGTRVSVAVGNELGIEPSDFYRVREDLKVDVVDISQEGVLTVGPYTDICNPLRKGTFSSDHFEIVIHKEMQGRFCYILKVKDNQVIEVKRHHATIDDDGIVSTIETLDVLEIALDYIENPDHIWDKTKYLGNSQRVGIALGKPASLTVMYVRGAAFISGRIGDTQVEIAYLYLQGYQGKAMTGDDLVQLKGEFDHTNRQTFIEKLQIYV